MKKVIDGKLYCTDTAIQLGRDFEESCGDFDYLEEALYRAKRSGRYFLYGAGGARTRYASHVGSGWMASGEAIVPLTREEALAWASEHLDGEAVIAEFGDLVEAV